MAIAEFTDRVRLRLSATLDDNEAMGLNFAQTCGFLFAMICSPEMIPSHEWIDAVVGEHVFEDQDSAEQFFSDLMSLYNWILDRSQNRELPLPDGIGLRQEPMANFDDDAPFKAWSQGFCTGHGWTEESWNEFGPDDEDLGLALMSLGFFSSRRFAETISADMFEGDMNVERIALTVSKLMPEAFDVYAAAGRAGQRALQGTDHPQAISQKIGRNEPCPCGSGLKYKRCCGQPGKPAGPRLH